MKKLLFIALIFVKANLYAQHTDCLSKELIIKGEVKTELGFDMKTMAALQTVKLADVVITNHKGEVKRTLTGLEGIPVKELLQKAAIKTDSPKLLSEFYLVFTACDGYKVVYSWNEVFNNPAGNTIYLIKEKNGESISSITTSDVMTGRRYVQGLSSITINRIQ